MISDAMMKIGSGIQKLIGGDSQIHRQHGDRISLFSFLNKESRLKKKRILTIYYILN
jgi:hypothetical protein